MTRQSIQEYGQAVRERYKRASKAEKGRILDEFTKTTGLHRKAVIRLLNRAGMYPVKKRIGRPQKYGCEVVEALKKVWQASDRLCSKRLKPFMPEMLYVLKRHGEIHLNAFTEVQLCRMSPATIDRLLRPWRSIGGRRRKCPARPSAAFPKPLPDHWRSRRPEAA